MKFKTVYSGEKAVVIKRDGHYHMVDGPQRLFVCFDKLEKLRRYVANIGEYLVISYLNGTIEHRCGPTSEWFNRFVHSSMKIEKQIELNEGQMVVFYANDDNSIVKRFYKCGPCVYMPKHNERIYEFKWHGEDPNKIGHVVPNARVFSILNTKADFFNYYVHEVRTLDDTLLTIKIMIVYELENIEKMLDGTQDPIADFMNNACADVISFVSKLTFSEFLSNSSKLNDLKTFEQLVTRAKLIGYNIKTVLYNGYSSSQALQEIQDNSITQRTQIRLNIETNKEKQRILDLKNQMELKKHNLEIKLKETINDYECEIQDEKNKHTIELNDLKHKTQIEIDNKKQEQAIVLKQKEQEIDQLYYLELKKMDVDLNKYLNESLKSKNKVSKQYQIV